MSKSNLEAIEVCPGEKKGYKASLDGKAMKLPEGWGILKPGDAALSRRIKMEGPSWTVIEIKRRKKFSHGIFAPAEKINHLVAERRAEKEAPKYQQKLNAGRDRRAKAEEAYAEEFEQVVFQFLDFNEDHIDLANTLAKAVTVHAIPVGSGTVARTQRIPIERRAEAAVIAWMRHQTTAYDQLTIPREKGARREVRRMLAERSRKLLNRYRISNGEDSSNCPLKVVLQK